MEYAKRYAIYSRKSTEDEKRQIASIKDQIDWCNDIKRKNNFIVVEEINDEKTWTKPLIRDWFNKLMRLVHAWKVDWIICWKIDRLARNPVDEWQIKWAFMEKKIKHICASDRQFYEWDSQILMSIDFSAATQYSIDLSNNVKRWLSWKIKRWEWIARAPLWYLNFNDNRWHHWVDLDQERKDILVKCWELFATWTYSIPDIKKYADNAWLKTRETKNTPKTNTVWINTFYKMFRNVFYMWKIEIKWEIYNWSHKPMISPQLFYQDQEVLRTRWLNHYIKAKSKEFVFSWVIECWWCWCQVVCEDKIKYKCINCNKRNTASNHVPSNCPSCKAKLTKEVYQNAKHYSYAHCTWKNKAKKACIQSYYSTWRWKSCISLDELETQVNDMIWSLSIDDKTLDYCKELLKDENFQNTQIQSISRDNLHKEHDQIEKCFQRKNLNLKRGEMK